MRFARQAIRSVAVSLAVVMGGVAVAVCSDSTRPVDGGSASKILIADDFESVSVCKISGPAGSYDYSVGVAGGGHYVLPAGNVATIAFDGETPICRRVYETTDADTWIGGITATVTLSEINLPSTVQVDSIIVTGALGNTQRITSGVAASVTVSGTPGEQFVKYYNGDKEITITPCPAGTFEYSFNAAGDLLIKYDQFPAPNDNSYGINAVGWGTKGHTFSNLVGSDHAGFQVRDAAGVVKLSFNVDYLTANAAAPSGYASLGVNGGDGQMIVGTAAGITATSSLANNLNNINIPGLFNAAHVQQFGSVNVLVNSPPTDPAHLTYDISDPLLAGWDFHDTYYVTISAAKLASLGFDRNTWKVEPNPEQLHNSPPKPCPVNTGPGTCSLALTKVEFHDKELKLSISNTGTSDVFLSDVVIDWPTTNGKLMQVKLEGDVVYDKPDIAGGSAHLTLANLVGDQNKRKLTKGKTEILKFVFEKRADIDLSHYFATASFGDCLVALLPR